MAYKDQVKGVIEAVYRKMDYTLDDEVLNVLLDDSQHKIIKAPAGGTKTTMTQFMENLYKLHFMVEGVKTNSKLGADGKPISPRDRVATTIPADKILCLVYNRHNTADIDTVHAKFYNSLVDLKFISASPSAKNFVIPGVVASTMHSFAEKRVISENLPLLKLREFKLANDDNINAQFRSVVKSVMESSSIQLTTQLQNDIKALYDLHVNLMLYKTEAPLTDSVQFELALSGTQVPSKYLREIFKKFDSRKKMLKLWEYSDQLRLADDLLQDPKVKEYYSNFFYSIVADEIQDFTPLMISILKSIIGPNTKTVSVGDGDQSIYSFLGAVLDGVENFSKMLDIDANYFTLKINRRCKKDTLVFALNVINSIPGREPREIKAQKIGGTLDRIFYSDSVEQITAIDSVMKSKVTGNMGVLFRKKADSIMLSRFLYKRGIPANYINAHNCMEHGLYTKFLEVITELFINKSHRGLRLLNRILPFNKQTIEEFLEIDEKTGVSKICPNPGSWSSLDFSPLYATSRSYMSINSQVEFAQSVARESYSITGSDCMDRLLDMFYKNYYSYLTEAQEDPYVELVLGWAKEDLSIGYPLKNVIENLNKNIVTFMGHSRKIGKLNICTIHGTKGLEFNHVIIANLTKEQTPAGLILSAAAAAFKEAEENRLLYVASTRQKDSLTALCDSENKHRLSDDAYFKTQEPVVTEAKFSGAVPSMLTDNLLMKAKPSLGRKSMILED
jgi:superfamily I DNA/RNA helicase